jgi:hypothetical protein
MLFCLVTNRTPRLPSPNSVLMRPVVFTLVHGTWAQDASWTEEGSALRTALDKSLGALVVFRVFHWSGRNSFHARTSGGDELREFLKQGLQMFPSASHLLISHSHGGNLVLHALEDLNLRSRIYGSVCLSTPFITVSDRNFGDFMGFALTAMNWGFAFCASVALGFKVPFLRAFYLSTIGQDHPTSMQTWASLLVFIPQVVFFWAALYLPARAWKKFAVEFRKRQTRRAVDDLNLLVIRPTADEASGALTTTQFFAWAATIFWQKLASVPEVLKFATWHWKEWARDHKLFAWLISFAPGLVLFVWQPAHTVSELLLAAVIVSFLTVSLRFYGLPMFTGWLLFFSTPIVGILVFPLFALLALVMMPFSPLDAFLFGPLQITVEASPVGSCRIVQLPSMKSPGLVHSSTYENALALRTIVEWVSAGRDSASLSADAQEEWYRAKKEAELQSYAARSAVEKTRRIRLAFKYAKIVIVIAFLTIAGRYLGRLYTNHHADNITTTYAPFLEENLGPGTPINIVVTRAAFKKEDKLHVTLQIPRNAETDGRAYSYIYIYGYQVVGDKRTNDVPSDVFQNRYGSWRAGDWIALDINVPKKFSDGSAGRVLRLGIGDDKGYYPSSNLLAGDALK